MDCGASLVAQWLKICTSIARSTDSTSGWGTKILHAEWHRQPKVSKNKLNMDHGLTSWPVADDLVISHSFII